MLVLCDSASRLADGGGSCNVTFCEVEVAATAKIKEHEVPVKESKVHEKATKVEHVGTEDVALTKSKEREVLKEWTVVDAVV